MRFNLQCYTLKKSLAARSARSIAHAALALTLCASSASALDTDIYFDRSVDELPNIVFYLDTSASMRASISDVPVPYDPLTSYTGVFDADTLYYAPLGRVPSTPSAISSGARGYLHCDVANTGIDTRGFFSGRFAARLPNQVSGNATAQDVWLPIDRGVWSTTDSHMVDCHEDRGTHGENGSSGSDYYLSVSTASAWTGNATHEIDWDATGFTTVYLGNFINYKLNPPIEAGTISRSTAMKRVIHNVIHLFPNINAGLSNMNARVSVGRDSRGGSIIVPVTDHTDPAARDAFDIALNATGTGAYTPLAEGLYEVYRYFRGDEQYFGETTHPGALSGNTYISPITHECQRNHVLMFTDGRPYTDSEQAVFTTLPNFGAVTGNSACVVGTRNRTSATSCLDELSAYMASEDASLSLPNVFDDDNDGTNEGQTVKVHPVGVQIDFDMLQDVADAAGTNYYSAQNARQVENDLVEILSNITGNSSVASRLVTSSDQFSRISHRNEIYTALYEPTSYYQWKGNIKKYRIAYNGVTPYLTDSDEANNPDILTTGGSIIPTAQSYWTSSPDGNNITEGGVRERLKAKDPSTRNFYGIIDNSQADLTHSVHELSLSNAAVDNALGATDRSTTERQDILDFALGFDIKDEDADPATNSRGHIGAMARNEPLVIQYGGSSGSPDLVVFAATSDGLLHGFDGETGDEIFAISPLDSVERFTDQFDNAVTGVTRGWGIDGQLAAYAIDSDKDGIIETADGDRVYLYVPFGLGARSMIVLDVTEANDRSNPKIELAKYKQHTAASNRWVEMGHMMTKPTHMRVNSNGAPFNLMVSALGYDPNAEYSYTGHTMGRGISMLEADGGTTAWLGVSNASTASAFKYFNNMDYAFVAEPSPVDTNGDGFTDRFYAADLGAQVWRFDFDDDFTARSSTAVEGHLLATLGNDSTGDRRRVFKPIQTALVKDSLSTWVALAFGTGDRMNPLTSENDNRLYMLKDTDVNTATSSITTLDNNDLYDATANALGTITDQTQLLNEYQELRDAKGWYIDLPDDRKAISTPLISNGIVNYPVYTIPSNSNPCERNLGTGTLYRMALYDAQPVFDYNVNLGIDTADREVPLSAPGIPADLVSHRDEAGNLSVCAGLECLPADPTISAGDETPEIFENYWYQRNN